MFQLQYLFTIHILYFYSPAITLELEENLNLITGCSNCSCTMDKISNKYITAVCPNVPSSLDTRIRSLTVQGSIPIISKFVTSPLMKIDILNMSNCEIEHIIDGFNKVNNFKTLILSNNKIEKIKENYLWNLTLLQILYLDHNRIKVLDRTSFTKLKSLQQLHLQGNQIKDIVFLNELPPNLIKLDLSSNNITDIPEIFKSNITNLNICDNPIEKAIGLHKMKQLKELCLPGVKYVPQAGLGAQINKLTFSGTNNNTSYNFTNQMKSNVASMENLTYISIDNYIINSFDFLKDLNHLETIRLVKIQLQEPGHISQLLNGNAPIRTLVLDESPVMIKQLLSTYNIIPKVRELSMRNNKLTTLQPFPSVKSLKRIDISDNPLNCSSQNWDWLKEIMVDIQKFIINIEELKCYYPKELKGHSLLKVLNFQDAKLSHLKQVSFEGDTNLDEFLLYSGSAILFVLTVIVALIIVYTFIHKSRLKTQNTSFELNHEVINRGYNLENMTTT